VKFLEAPVQCDGYTGLDFSSSGDDGFGSEVIESSKPVFLAVLIKDAPCEALSVLRRLVSKRR
jgi:hypothetical protein